MVGMMTPKIESPTPANGPMRPVLMPAIASLPESLSSGSTAQLMPRITNAVCGVVLKNCRWFSTASWRASSSPS